MIDLRKAAQQALDALEYHVAQTRPIHETSEAITALRAALQDEGKQEPVAYIRTEDGLLAKNDGGTFGPRWTPLYAAPPQRPLMTDEELDQTTAQARDDLLDHIYEYGTTAEGILERVRKLSRAIERKVRGEEE
jgi:hypothetical protein